MVLLRCTPRNIQTLSVELFKVKNSLSSEITNNIFEKHQIVNYSLRSQADFLHPLQEPVIMA